MSKNGVDTIAILIAWPKRKIIPYYPLSLIGTELIV